MSARFMYSSFSLKVPRPPVESADVRQIALLPLVAALALALLRPGFGEESAMTHPPRAGAFTILHTNDFHGYALSETPRPRKNRKRPPQGGVAAVAAVFAKIKGEVGADKVLTLDAGDLLTGHPAASIAEDGVVGATFVRAWSGIGFDA